MALSCVLISTLFGPFPGHIAKKEGIKGLTATVLRIVLVCEESRAIP